MSAESVRTDNRQRVLDGADIVQLIGEHIALRAKGREYIGLCPFHDDHKPSLYVVPHKQIYHCFSCGAGGNAFDFVMNFHKMEFKDALHYLAERANVELTPLPRSDAAQGPTGVAQPDTEHKGPSRADIAQANQFALEFFRAILIHPEHGASARALLEKRRITDEMSQRFELGAAPDRWDGLLLTASEKGVSKAALHAAGLIKDRSTGDGSYDAFRNRLIFPIHDQIGRPIAFGGRVLGEAGEGEPKYLNSSESPLFDKSSTLFGLKQALRAIQSERTAIITEGYTDVIACHQAGICNVVATLGVALTPRHGAILRRLCDTVVMLFDGDDAGLKAADRAVELFFTHPIDVRIALLPDGLDPDELLRLEDGPSRFKQAVENAIDALEFRFARLRSRLQGVGLSARSRLIEEDMARLADLGLNSIRPIRRRLIIRSLASLLGVDEATIVRSIPAGRRPAPHQGDTSDQSSTARAPRTPAEHALGCLLCELPLWWSIDERQRDLLAPGAYAEGPLREVAEAIQRFTGEHQTAPATEQPWLSIALGRLRSTQARQAAVQLAADTERQTDGDPVRLSEHFQACLVTAAQRKGRQQATDQSEAESKTQSATDTSKLAELLQSRRDEHLRLGGDPLALPRAPTSVG